MNGYIDCAFISDFFSILYCIPMKFDKKTTIIVASSAAGLLLLCGVFCFAFHGRYEWRERREQWGKFENGACGQMFGKDQQAGMLSGMDAVITSKDYAAFQKLVSGSRMAETINTPAKFATRVELQATMKKTRDLQNQLWSWSTVPGCPMMNDEWRAGRPMMRWNMMRR